MRITHKNTEYEIGSLNAFEQLRISQVLLPLIPKLGAINLKNEENPEKELAELSPLFEAFANIPEEKVQGIIHLCLSKVQRKHSHAFTYVSVNNVLAFDDMDMLDLLLLSFEVIKPFLQGIFKSLPEAMQAKLPQQMQTM